MIRLFRRFKDLVIEGQKADYYDTIARGHRIGKMQEQAKEIIKHIKDGDSLLEIAPEAGYPSIELTKRGNYKITGKVWD